MYVLYNPEWADPIGERFTTLEDAEAALRKLVAEFADEPEQWTTVVAELVPRRQVTFIITDAGRAA